MIEISESTKKKQIIEAVKRMEILDSILDFNISTVKDFERDGTVYYSERRSNIFYKELSRVEDDPKITSIIEELEKQWGALVYHVSLSYDSLNCWWSFLYVSAHEEEWEKDKGNLEDGLPYVYCYDKTEDRCYWGRIDLCSE